LQKQLRMTDSRQIQRMLHKQKSPDIACLILQRALRSRPTYYRYTYRSS